MINSRFSRLAWVEGNYSLVLSKLTPGDTGDWFCTVNGRSQYLHKHSILVRGKHSILVRGKHYILVRGKHYILVRGKHFLMRKMKRQRNEKKKKERDKRRR